jgi:hypothetical protein
MSKLASIDPHRHPAVLLARRMSCLAIVLVLLAGVALADETAAFSPIVYPPQRMPLVFSHRAHLARGTACDACHPDARGSRSAVDNLIPTEAACRACHAIERDKPDKQATPVAACAGCHAGYAPGRAIARVSVSSPPLKFAHAAHPQPCESCHPVRAVDLATTAQLPTMASCLRCHADGGDERRCADCHLARAGGLVETTFDHGELVPQRAGLGDDHGPGFAVDHKTQARQVGATCTACHDRSECIACHQGTVKPMEFHAGNYVLLHAIDARRGKPDCSACHREASFCVGCHERSGVGMRVGSTYSTTDPSRAFHRAGWASPQGGGPNLHAQEARRNIASCASCHRDDDCTTCHGADRTKGRVSPHPSTWRGSARCRALDRGDRRMCLRCHVSASEVGCDWSGASAR